mmetsp:Transcript_4324/g.17727  ORF Transcript_4324/g.17727 Transcript_4324/m.17727 type:complete len:232 (-) Transcript_4324:1223-1918(-)
MYQHVGNCVVLETLANRYLLMIKIVHGRIVARSHHAFPFLLEHLSHLPHAHHYPALDLLLVLNNLAEPHCVALAPPIEWVIESPVVVLQPLIPVRVGKLVCGDVAEHLRQLRACEHQHREQNGDVADDEGNHAGVGPLRGRGPTLPEPLQSHSERGCHRDSLQAQKYDEIAVVTFPNCVSHPRAVVVESADAPVGHAAVLCSPRFDDPARRAHAPPVSRPQLRVVQRRVEL